MRRILSILIATIALFSLLNIGVASASSLVGDACQGLQTVSSTASCSANGGTSTIKSIASKVVNVLSIITGAIAVIMLIIAGLRFVTANGDANNISAARNMIVYAIVGIVIVVLAQLIVRLVLNSANKVQANSYLNSQSVIRNDA